MNAVKVLVVEDEILTSKTIEIYLQERGHIFVKNSISYENAINVLNEDEIDLVLIDIKLYGHKSGIDLAWYLKEHHPDIPFIFLTSQYDHMTLNKALDTFPAAYLTKPIQKESLWATIELVVKSKSENTPDHDPDIIISDGKRSHKIKEKDIQFVKAEHVYIKVFTKNNTPILTRKSLTQLLKELKSDFFVQCHKSFVVNMNFIESWDIFELVIAENTIPVSRSKRKEIIKSLNTK